MLFNSLEFLIFLPTVFAAYWFLNLWTKSYTRSASAEPPAVDCKLRLLRVVGLAFFVAHCLLDARGLCRWTPNRQGQCPRHPSRRGRLGAHHSAKRWLWVSLVVNLGLLGYFKYANFFIENWIGDWSAVGVHMNPWSLKVILPVGISFYTFQTLSYSIDIYRRRLQPSQGLIQTFRFPQSWLAPLNGRRPCCLKS